MPEDVGRGARAPRELALWRCSAAKKLENAGDFEAARDVLLPLWPRVGERPALEGLGGRERAEVLLRVGALTRRLGRAHSLAGSQKVARDLIRESAELFRSLGEEVRAREAAVELASCYYWEGALNAARSTLRAALEEPAAGDERLRASALMLSAAVEFSADRVGEARSLLDAAAALLAGGDDNLQRGRLHNQYGLVFWSEGRSRRDRAHLGRALEEYRAALSHFEAAGHVRNLARVENNIGLLYFEMAAAGVEPGALGEAFRHLERAREIFRRLRDDAQAAQADESLARVLLAQGRTAEAASLIENAVAVFEKGGQQDLLAEALRTQGVILARLGRPKEAAAAHGRAIELVAVNRVRPTDL